MTSSAFCSPARLQSHLQTRPDPCIEDQLAASCGWLLDQVAHGEERLLATCRWTPSKLQDGPQCGMVALWMAAQGLLHEGPVPSAALPSVDDIQSTAVAMGFSRRGEMFSAANLAQLAETMLCRNSIRAEALHGFAEACSSLQSATQLLLTGDRLLLVPYDADFDQHPGMKQGHKAHWAVLCGLVAVLPSQLVTATMPEQLGADQTLTICQAGSALTQFTNSCSRSQQPFYWVARQSKSRRLFLFDPDKLASSNANLLELPTSRQEQFVLPEGGVARGLAGQFVLLSKRG